MEDKMNLENYWKIIMKKKKFIIYTTLLIVSITAIVSLLTPKIYESEATIRLGKVNERQILQPEEAKYILQSPIVLGPVIDKLFSGEEKPSVKKFNNRYLEINILTEKAANSPRIIPYMTIKAKSTEAIKSKEITLAIINEFFTNANKKFNEKKELAIKNAYKPVELGKILYNIKAESILERIKITEENIAWIKADIAGKEARIASLSSSRQSTQDKIEITLLEPILENNKKSLSEQEGVKTSWEEQLVNLKVDLKKAEKIAEYNLEAALTNTDEFQIIIQPQIPLKPSWPNIGKNLLIALVAGLFLSVMLVNFK